MDACADSLDCPICLETFKDPLILSACGHSLCSACVQKLLDGPPKRESVTCPECRTQSDVPNTGLRKNYRLADVVEKMEAASNRKMMSCNECESAVLIEKLYECATCKEGMAEAANNATVLCADCALTRHREHNIGCFGIASKQEIEAAGAVLTANHAEASAVLASALEKVDALTNLGSTALKELRKCVQEQKKGIDEITTSEVVPKKDMDEAIQASERIAQIMDHISEQLRLASDSCTPHIERIIAECQRVRRYHEDEEDEDEEDSDGECNEERSGDWDDEDEEGVLWSRRLLANTQHTSDSENEDEEDGYNEYEEEVTRTTESSRTEQSGDEDDEGEGNEELCVSDDDHVKEDSGDSENENEEAGSNKSDSDDEEEGDGDDDGGTTESSASEDSGDEYDAASSDDNEGEDGERRRAPKRRRRV